MQTMHCEPSCSERQELALTVHADLFPIPLRRHKELSPMKGAPGGHEERKTRGYPTVSDEVAAAFP